MCISSRSHASVRNNTNTYTVCRRGAACMHSIMLAHHGVRDEQLCWRAVYTSAPMTVWGWELCCAGYVGSVEGFGVER